MAIAVSAAVSLLLLYRILLRQHGSPVVPLATVCIFFSLSRSIILSTDVMLEFPSLALALAAIMFFREVDGKWRLRDGLLFGLLGGAAVCTKQHAVFIGLVPFAFILLSRKWHLLVGRTLWISTAVFSLPVLGLMAISLSNAGVGVSGQVSVENSSIFVRNIRYYSSTIWGELGFVPGMVCVIAGIGFLALVLKPGDRSIQAGRNILMLSWAICMMAMLMVLRQYDNRYLFNAYPAMIGLGCSGVYEVCRRMTSPIAAKWIVAVCVMFMMGPRITTIPTFLAGVGDSAEYVKNKGAVRILYCGYFSGSFCFALRSQSEPLQKFVLRSDKLKKEQFEPDRFEQFAHRFGIEYVVVEQNTLPDAWDRLVTDLSPSLELERTFKLTIPTLPERQGKLLVYRFANPSKEPEDPSELQLSTIGSYLGRSVKGILDSEKE